MASCAGPSRQSGASAEVITTTHAAFAETHREEEGDLDVVVDGDVIHLRSFKPVAQVDAVSQAATDAASVLASGPVRADINTSDVEKTPHVFTQYRVTIEDSGQAFHSGDAPRVDHPRRVLVRHRRSGSSTGAGPLLRPRDGGAA